MKGTVLAAALYAALTIVFAWPLSADPAGRVLSDSPDTELFLWTLSWDTHSFTHAPLSIFDANIYHPERNTLAYSENLIGSALLAAPILWLTHNPVLALNLVGLLSCVLCGVGAYVLARRTGIAAPGATLSGLIFAFSPPRFFRLGQLHLTAVQWVPFTLAALHAYLDSGRPVHLRIAAALFTLQAYTSGHGAVFLIIASAGLIAYRLVRGEPVAFTRRLRDLGFPGVLLLLPSVLLYLPYRSVQQEMGLRRSLVDWGINPGSFLASPAHAQTWLLSLFPAAQINETAWAYLFPGFLPLVLATLLLLLRARSSDAAPGADTPTRKPFVASGFSRTVAPVGPAEAGHYEQDRPIVRSMPFYALLTILALWLSIGPPLGLWPLVYWMPGFSFIRVPARFTILALLGLAVLAGAGFERLRGRLSPRTGIVLAVVMGALLVGEFAAMPLATVPYEVELPSVDRWLRTQTPPFAIAEVPLPNPRNLGATERRHTEYMLHSTAHWQKTVHGYSGFRPPRHVEMYSELREFPDERSLRRLAEIGVRYVVVHTDLYEPGEWPRAEARIASFASRLTLEYTAGAGRVYSIRP